jgi:uncharacterized membrane protein
MRDIAQPSSVDRQRQAPIGNGAISHQLGNPLLMGWQLALTVALAALLRTTHLGTKSFWADEAASVVFAKLGWAEFWHTLTTSEANMGLYYLLLRGWVQINDHGWFVRLLSAVAAVATVPAVYAISRIVFSHRAGMIAALLLAVNVFHVTFSQEARSYSLAVLLVTCSCLFFVQAMKMPQRRSGALYILTSAAALYAHFFAALVLAVQAVSLLFFPPPRALVWKQLRLMLIIAGLGFPLLLFILLRSSDQLDWVQPSSARGVYHFFTYLTGSGLKFIIALIALALAFRRWSVQRSQQKWSVGTWSFLFVSLWLGLPVVVTLFFSHWKPLFAPRFLLICLPASVILVGQGLAEISRNWVRRTAVTVVVLSSIWTLRTYYRQPPQEDWKSATRFLIQNAQPGDAVFFSSQYCRLPFDYSLRDSGIHASLPEISYSGQQPASQELSQITHMWAISCNATKKTVADAYIFLRVSGFRLQRAVRFNGVQVEEFTNSQPGAGAH